MATVEECERALHRLADALRGPEGSTARQHIAERSVSCRLTDLEVTFVGQLRDGELRDIEARGDGSGQIRLTMTSDDLIALTDGSLSFGRAWASGRVKVHAGVVDLIKLRKLF